MKKLLLSAAVIALGVIGMANVPTAVNAATPECKVATVGKTNTANKPHSVFAIKNGVASVKYKVTGKKNCKVTVELKSYYTLNKGGLPREAQVKYMTTTKTVGVGTRTISVQLPPDNCYYQVDFVRVIQNKQPGQKNKMLAYHLKGTHSCLTTPPEEPEVPETPETPETPKAETPAELPQTGAAAVAMQLVGATSLGGSAAYYLQSRRMK